MFYHPVMLDADPRHIADILIEAPVIIRLGLAAPDARLREKAAAKLGELVAKYLSEPPRCRDDRQMWLPIGER